MGRIFNIQKYALHDGPGIRTTVFLKGCPLKCLWCHNPESINPEFQIIRHESKCINCQSCDHYTKADQCPTLALEAIGKEMTASEVFDEINKDMVFYDQSGGGVTFSGGEPLMQSAFLLEILKLCKAHNIHTTIDTSGYVPYQTLEPLLAYVDLFLYDIKQMNNQMHLKYTGVENTLILENFVKLAKVSKIQVRVPLIKGFNDSLEHIELLLGFIKQEKVTEINFLPYHAYAEHKYHELDHNFVEFEKPDQAQLDAILDICSKKKVLCKIGG